MKCQKCDKQATFHITDLVDGKPNELHLCEECAHKFLAPASDDANEVLPAMAGLWPLAKPRKSSPGSTNDPAPCAASRFSNSASRAA
jgi:hypothetical protein